MAKRPPQKFEKPFLIFNQTSGKRLKSGKEVKVFLILTMILTGELPDMAQRMRTPAQGIRLVLRDHPP